MNEQHVVEATKRWLEAFVIGLNLCPFAERPFRGGGIRHVVSAATEENGLLEDLRTELRRLAASEEIETTLLIHQPVLTDFLDYNDFLDPAEKQVQALGLEGVIQIASFHPQYQFAGTEGDDVENYTNRSPFPMLHLLREESVTRVAASDEEMMAI